MIRLYCAMSVKCEDEVTHLDEKGYIYCAAHGKERRQGPWGPRCRKLTPTELRILQGGGFIQTYSKGKR